MMSSNLKRFKKRNSDENFIKGYQKAIKDVEWLKNKIERDNAEKTAGKFFSSSGKLGS